MGVVCVMVRASGLRACGALLAARTPRGTRRSPSLTCLPGPACSRVADCRDLFGATISDPEAAAVPGHYEGWCGRRRRRGLFALGAVGAAAAVAQALGAGLCFRLAHVCPDPLLTCITRQLLLGSVWLLQG
jgi:hypothetical protein